MDLVEDDDPRRRIKLVILHAIEPMYACSEHPSKTDYSALQNRYCDNYWYYKYMHLHPGRGYQQLLRCLMRCSETGISVVAIQQQPICGNSAYLDPARHNLPPTAAWAICIHLITMLSIA
ncbi:hypothetical protein TRIATDRAFT_92883 [Trichoderma atroviride IMI 206040]|uniref:Uncharacterized protein n=1 Tax=Hypocrea atroviridis (strain ATCC 20476 / IMI 206040) TaxID=452589 RepID=G9NHB8_HYPAI|nr:uncharacterized protein TRIATDRAFT_92883 [Trichoderma atroviride IMI 206040]EHK50012.1 hypothetical protein TRIATDRAFT_92883 [Trichoderma atroviride IMI 206040]